MCIYCILDMGKYQKVPKECDLASTGTQLVDNRTFENENNLDDQANP